MVDRSEPYVTDYLAGFDRHERQRERPVAPQRAYDLCFALVTERHRRERAARERVDRCFSSALSARMSMAEIGL